MSIANLTTRGFAIGPLTKLVTMGYSISTFTPSVVPVTDGLVGNQTMGNGVMSNQTPSSGLTGRGRL